VCGSDSGGKESRRPHFVADEPQACGATAQARIDPESSDASAPAFAVSIKSKETSRPRFIPNEQDVLSGNLEAEVDDGPPSPAAPLGRGENLSDTGLLPAETTSLQCAPEEDSWRDEVSARLQRYRARRRPLEPRYPSLRLKFEVPETWGASAGATESASPPLLSNAAPALVSQQEPAAERVEQTPASPLEESVQETRYSVEPEPSQTTAKIIEFPGPAYAPPLPLHELAEPVVDRPRILEAPEVVPPPPALGGIIIEEEHRVEPERRPGIDMPLHGAPAGRRLIAASVDLLIVLVACGVFGAIFGQIVGVRPPLWQAAGLALVLPAILWMGYQYLLVVYSGSTPGLRAAGLELLGFDGTRPSRRRRRARVLASFLSGASLGLGYLWQFLDEDGLCWHDRVMKTYLAPTR
jgi:uncharacterized RDD family membrane protein YckC